MFTVCADINLFTHSVCKEQLCRVRTEVLEMLSLLGIWSVKFNSATKRNKFVKFFLSAQLDVYNMLFISTALTGHRNTQSKWIGWNLTSLWINQAVSTSSSQSLVHSYKHVSKCLLIMFCQNTQRNKARYCASNRNTTMLTYCWHVSAQHSTLYHTQLQRTSKEGAQVSFYFKCRV